MPSLGGIDSRCPPRTAVFDITLRYPRAPRSHRSHRKSRRRIPFAWRPVVGRDLVAGAAALDHVGRYRRVRVGTDKREDRRRPETGADQRREVRAQAEAYTPPARRGDPTPGCRRNSLCDRQNLRRGCEHDQPSRLRYAVSSLIFTGSAMTRLIKMPIRPILSGALGAGIDEQSRLLSFHVSRLAWISTARNLPHIVSIARHMTQRADPVLRY
jgi:hypothetical protein